MHRAFVYFMAILGGAAFLFMVKLMYDMTGHMARMTDHVAVMSNDRGRMRSHMETRVLQVAGIEISVSQMDSLAADVHGMRQNVGAMAGVLHKGGEQIERLNPMQMMEQMMAPGMQGTRPAPRQ